MKNKLILSFLVIILFLNSLGTTYITAFAALTPGEEITIEGIRAHDFIGIPVKHPTTLKEVLEYVDSGGYVSGRTGWSAYDLLCVVDVENGGTKWEKDQVVYTSDSGRDKHYAVADYESEIVAKYGREVYEAALASGKSLQYQEGSKTESPTGKEWKWFPCQVGERGGYYNDLDFDLTLTFKVDEEEETDPSEPGTPGGSCSLQIVPEGFGGSMNGSSTTPTVSGSISSDSGEFDVTQGIPSSEYVRVDASGDEYLYGFDFSQHTGKVVYTLEIPKTFNLTWTTKTGTGKDQVIKNHKETVEKSVTVTVERPWTYWEVVSYWVSQLQGATITNYALPNESITFPANVNVSADANTDKNIDNHVFPADCPTIDLGSEDIDGGSSKPSIPDFTGEAEGEAESQVGDTEVKNDSASFKGQTIMDDAQTTTDGPTPSDIPPASQISFGQGGLLIDPLKTNYYEAPSTGTMHYVSVININGQAPGDFPFPVNHVTVHTPVVIFARASDDKEHDQRIKPPLRSTPANPDTDRHAFILDRPFTVTLPTIGQHRNIPGYGYRDYAKYTKEKQVKFPFDVYSETKQAFYAANTWISIPVNMETATFFLPVWVPEGKYTVDFRAFAINALNGGDFGGSEHEANVTIPNAQFNVPPAGYLSAAHVATDSIEVDVVGRLYDFQITDIADFNWQSTFRQSDGVTPTGKSYFVGLNGIDGQPRGNQQPFTLPVRHGSNPNGLNNVAVKTGYKFSFNMKTKGDMQGLKDAIRITPKFYFVSRDGKKRQEVDLYYHTDDQYFVKVGSEKDTVNRTVALNESLRNVPTNELTNNALHYYDYAERFNLQDITSQYYRPAFARQYMKHMSKESVTTGPFGWQILNWKLRTYRGPLENQVPPNTMIPPKETVTKEQTWYSEYSIPAQTYAVAKGTNISEVGLYNKLDEHNSIFLKDGFIIVNFSIETIRNGDLNNPYLHYINAYYMNQWADMEGFKYSFVDAYGKTFNLLDGDVIFYHADSSANSDFKPSVTH